MPFAFLNRFKKILIVEDDKALRRAIITKLTGEGYSLLEAGDGEEGLRIAKEKRPDLILLDIMLPKMDGMELLERLREDTWGADVPVVIITVLGESDERRLKAEKLRALDYIDKSKVELSDIIDKVERVLRG